MNLSVVQTMMPGADVAWGGERIAAMVIMARWLTARFL